VRAGRCSAAASRPSALVVTLFRRHHGRFFSFTVLIVISVNAELVVRARLARARRGFRIAREARVHAASPLDVRAAATAAAPSAPRGGLRRREFARDVRRDTPPLLTGVARDPINRLGRLPRCAPRRWDGTRR
jgi:hypothetical protein